MPRIKTTIPSVPEFGLSEYIYTLAFELTSEQKKAIPSALLRQVKTAKKAAKFANDSSTDQKREFFSYLDFDTFLVSINRKYATPENFKTVLKEYRREKPSTAVVDMVKKGFYVSSDLDFAEALTLLSAGKNSAAYKMNHQLRRVGYHFRKWPTILNHPKEKEYEDLQKSAQVFNKVASAVNNTMDVVDVFTGVEKIDMRILLYLAEDIRGYRSYDEICDNFATLFFRKAISESLKRIKDGQFIQRHSNWRLKEYGITKLGVRTVAHFRESVLKSFNF